MGEQEDRKRERKRRLFRRDGWQDGNGEWFVMCAFGCGDVLGWHEAVINMHPVKKCDGGRYTFDNTRLVCRPCSLASCNHKTLPHARAIRRRALKPNRIAQPVSVSANIDRLQRLNARREARREVEANGGG